MKRMKTSMHRGFLFFTVTIIIITSFASLKAQRRRPSTTTSTRAVQSSSTERIEQRNQALLQQIMSLQKERDFYKEKITNWTKLQMNKPKPKTEPEEKKEKEKPAYASGAMAAYYLPITPDILDTLLHYRSQLRRPQGKQPMGVSGDSLFQYAQRLAVMGRYSEARSSYERLIRSRSVADRHYLEYGKFLYKTGDFQRALEILSGVTGGNHELAVASYYKGRIYQQNNANTVAQIDFYRSRYLDPEFPGADAAVAFAFLQSGEHDSAKAIFLQMVKKKSELCGELYYGLAQIADIQKNHGKAVNYYQKSLVHDPLFIKSYVELAKALYDTSDYQSCILFCQQVMDVYADTTLLNSYIARSRYFMKQWDAALTKFQRLGDSPQADAIKKEWIPKIQYIKCLIARESGDHKAALDYFRKAREMNPDASAWMTAALNDLGKIYAQDSDYNDALSYYSRLIRLDPGNMETVLKIGKFYYYLGDIDEARKYFTHALNSPESEKQADFWLRQINSMR